jgi:hypothetical protein
MLFDCDARHNFHLATWYTAESERRALADVAKLPEIVAQANYNVTPVIDRSFCSFSRQWKIPNEFMSSMSTQ